MRQRWILLLAGVAIVTVVGLCGAFAALGYVVAREIMASLPEETLPEEGRRFELPSTPPTTSTTLLEDDFSDPDSGWYTIAEPDVNIDYADGGYRFVIDAQETGYWETHRSVRLQRLGDVRIEADVQQIDGYSDDTFGIVCRANGDEYYALDVSADGWYGIGKVEGDEYTLLAGPDEEPSSEQTNIALLLQEPETYHLRADCIGDTLTLYVNDEQIAQAHDASFSRGGIGLSAYNYDAPRTEVRFDNIVVRTP